MVWRFEKRQNPFLFRDPMLKLIHSDNLESRKLLNAEKRQHGPGRGHVVRVG
jgi:hypothetical protein